MRQEIKIRTRQNELYGLISLHSYYEDKISFDFDFVATPETQAKLRNLYLNCKTFPYGLIISYHGEMSPPLLEDVSKEDKLTFYIYNRNSRLVNFTDIPFCHEDEILYFNNLDNQSFEQNVEFPDHIYYVFRNLDVNNPERSIVHPEYHTKCALRSKQFMYAQRKGDDLIPLKHNDLSISNARGETEDSTGRAFLQDVDTSRQREYNHHMERERRKLKEEGLSNSEMQPKLDAKREELLNILGNEELNQSPIDLRWHPNGLYSLDVKGEKAQNFYIAEDPDYRIFGVFEVYLSELIKDKEIQPKCDYIHFVPRDTYWRYHFLNYHDSAVQALEIEDENSEMEFTDAAPEHTEVFGKRSTLIATTKPITLIEKPKQIFWLKRKSGKRNLKDFKLPAPSLEIIKPEKEEDTIKVYSDIYVYL